MELGTQMTPASPGHGTRFAMIASGSDGNAGILQSGETLLLIDAGVSYPRLVAGLARLGLSPQQISAVLLTHEHGDHVCGLAALLRRHRCPVATTRETRQGLSHRGDLRTQAATEWIDLRPGQPSWLGGLEILPFHTSHDARGPVGYRVEAKDARVAYATDTGHATPELLEAVAGCELLALESNHCPDLLRHGPYPRRLKERVASDRGHLTNQQAAEVLGAAVSARLRAVLALHISKINNHPDLATRALTAGLADARSKARCLAVGRYGSGWIDCQTWGADGRANEEGPEPHALGETGDGAASSGRSASR